MARRGPLVKSVKVGPYRYRVVYDNVYLDSINALAVVRPKELTIMVKSGFAPLYELQIIFHATLEVQAEYDLNNATLEVQAEYDLNNNEAFKAGKIIKPSRGKYTLPDNNTHSPWGNE